MKTTNENPIQPMEDQPAKPVHIEKQENHNCQQFYGPVTGCVFAMPGATVNQYPNAVTTQNDAASKSSANDKTQPATRNPQFIIDYVMKLHPMYVRQGWREKYQALWNDVLELPAVAEKVYNKGKQQHEYEFNRDLVGKILRLLKTEGVMTHQANATKMSEELEGNKNSSVRTHLGLMPSDDVKTAVKALISQKGKEC